MGGISPRTAAGHDVLCPYEDKVVRGFAEWAASSQENVPLRKMAQGKRA